jgi:hypothetical protein
MRAERGSTGRRGAIALERHGPDCHDPWAKLTDRSKPTRFRRPSCAEAQSGDGPGGADSNPHRDRKNRPTLPLSYTRKGAAWAGSNLHEPAPPAWKASTLPAYAAPSWSRSGRHDSNVHEP